MERRMRRDVWSMSEIHNYRIRHSGGFAYFPTIEVFEKEIGLRTDTPLAEFYQPGIGWVRYTPEPKPVDYEAIIKRLVAAGDDLAAILHCQGNEFEEEFIWAKTRDLAEVKKALGRTTND